MKDQTTVEIRTPDGKTSGPVSLDKLKEGLRKLREVPLELKPPSVRRIIYDRSSASDTEPADIPADGDFKRDWLDDETLQEKGRDLIREKVDKELGQFDIRFLWKQTGGRRNGKATLGKTSLPRGYAKFYSKADALIWVAADHLRALKASCRFLEAVLYHELCHLKFDPVGGILLVGHDFEGFIAEFEQYGAWRTDLSNLAANLKQLKLL